MYDCPNGSHVHPSLPSRRGATINRATDQRAVATLGLRRGFAAMDPNSLRSATSATSLCAPYWLLSRGPAKCSAGAPAKVINTPKGAQGKEGTGEK